MKLIELVILVGHKILIRGLSGIRPQIIAEREENLMNGLDPGDGEAVLCINGTLIAGVCADVNDPGRLSQDRIGGALAHSCDGDTEPSRVAEAPELPYVHESP